MAAYSATNLPPGVGPAVAPAGRPAGVGEPIKQELPPGVGAPIAATPEDQSRPLNASEQGFVNRHKAHSDLEDLIRGKQYTTRPTEDPTNPNVSMLMDALERADRPRAAVVSAILAPKGKMGAEIMKGLRGEQHPLMGDYIFNKLEEAKADPAAHPYLNNMRNFLGKEIYFNIPADWRGEALAKHDWGGVRQEEAAKTEAAMATIGGLATDIVLDPLTYTGVGLTERGMTEMAVTAAKREGRTLGPEMAAKLAKLEAKGDIQEFRSTLEGQLRAGQKRVRIAGVPVPGAVSAAFVKGTTTFRDYLKGTTLGEGFTRAFSTKAGLEGDLSKFSELEERLNNLIVMGKDQAIRDGAEFGKQIKTFADELAGKTGKYVPPEDIGRIISEEAERAKRVAFVNNAPVEEVVRGSARLRRDWEAKVRTWDAKVRQKVRPEALDDQTRAYVLSHPEVQKFIYGLKTKNMQQLKDEMAAGIRISDQGTTTQTIIDKMDEALQAARDAGVDTVKNPITGRAIGREKLAAKVDKMRKAWDKQERIDYMIHAITPEAKKVVMAQSRRARVRGMISGREYSVQHASTLQRRFGNMSVAEINAKAAAGKLPGYEGIKIKKFFYDDPVIQQTIRDIRHRKAMAVADFFNETKARFGRSTDELRDEAIAAGAKKTINIEDALPEGLSTVKNPKAAALLKGYAFPDEVAARLDAHYEAMLDPKKTGEFLDLFDNVQGWWKAWTLGVFPSYHFRNAVGNVWNNFVTGTHDPAVYRIASRIQRGKDGALKTLDGRTIPFDEIKKHLDELGIRGRGFIGSDIEASLKAEMGGAKWATLSRDSKLIYYGRKLGTAVEDNARIAKFIDELHKGQDFRGAAQATKHALFDYTDLTHVEKTVAKRIAPFYTWSRKNIPLQVEGMLKSPGKYKAIDTARQEIEANSQDPNEYVLGNWLLENYAIRTKVEVDPQTGKRTPYYFMLGGWLPAADLWSMSANPTQFLLNQITPLAKVPAELWANKDFFTGREIQHYDSEKVSALGDRVRISPKMKHALRNIRILAMADAMLPESYKGVMPQGVRDMTADEKLLHFFTGIKLYGQDLLTQRMFDELDTQRRAKELTKYKVKGMRKESGVTDEERQGLDKEIQQQIDKSMRIFGAAPPSTDRAHSWEFVPTLPKQ